MKPTGQPWLVAPNEDDPSTWRLADNVEVCVDGIWQRASGIVKIEQDVLKDDIPNYWHFKLSLEDGGYAQISIRSDRPNSDIVRIAKKEP